MQKEVFEVILVAVVSNTVALGVLGFLFRSLIKHFLDKDINSYKSDLAAKNMKLQISYGGIYEKQADAIASLYSKLLELELGVENIRTPEQWNNYRDCIRGVANFYHEKRVFIPESLDSKILDVITKAHNALTQSLDGHTPAEFVTKFKEAKVAALEEMRRLLSVEANAIENS